MNLVQKSLTHGGKLVPVILPHNASLGMGLMNPSIYIDNDGDILLNLRHVNYTLYHSELDQRFFSPWGPLSYLHPEKDQRLVTTNFLCRLDADLNLINFTEVDYTTLNKPPIWEFVGEEDCRVVRWDGELYLIGVRRDTTVNGQGRMEYSKIELDKENWTAKEVQRVRMPAPLDEATSYCEKNWMPIIDQPYHFVKWAMPTEVVWSSPNEPKTKQILVKETPPVQIDQRGGSHVVRWGNYYLTVTHEVKLWKNYLNQKDSIYRHRLLVWDIDFNFVGLSKEFSFLDTPIEFCVGAAVREENLLLSFGVQDNCAFVLDVPGAVVNGLITEAMSYGN